MIVFMFMLFVLINACISMEQIPFHKCKGGNTVVAILMDPCDYVDNSASSPPKCTLHHGTTIKVNAIFIAPFSSSSLEIVSSVRIKHMEVPLKESGKNPCMGNLIPSCPVVKDNMYIFSGVFDMHAAYPVGAMDVTYAVRDMRTKKLLGCAVIPIVVKGKPKNEI